MSTSIMPNRYQKQQTRNQRSKCDCGGYWFPHRRGGGTCYTSPSRALLLAIRDQDQEAIMEAMVDRAFITRGRISPEPCPF